MALRMRYGGGSEARPIRDAGNILRVDGNHDAQEASEEKAMRTCAGKSVPTNASLYAKVKAEAKRKFHTYPSIYANSWLVREYKKRGGKYRCTTSGGSSGLRKWYKEKWVDLSRPLPGGGWAQCGRGKVDPKRWREKYPKCRPLSAAKRMTQAQIRSAVSRKRKAVRRQKRGKPVYVRTMKNPDARWMALVGISALAIAAIVWYSKKR